MSVCPERGKLCSYAFWISHTLFYQRFISWKQIALSRVSHECTIDLYLRAGVSNLWPSGWSGPKSDCNLLAKVRIGQEQSPAAAQPSCLVQVLCFINDMLIPCCHPCSVQRTALSPHATASDYHHCRNSCSK